MSLSDLRYDQKGNRQAGEPSAVTIYVQFDILGAHVSYHGQEFVASQPPAHVAGPRSLSQYFRKNT